MASYQCRGKNKLWSVRFNIIENNKLITKRLSGFERKKDAETAYREYLQNYKIEEENKKLETKDKKFKELFEEYLKYKATKIKESSYYDLIKSSEIHILPYFSELSIKDITKQKILHWQNSLDNYSYKYKSKLRNYLFGFYKYLFFYYDIDNLVARVEPFTRPNVKKEMNIWTLDEFNLFINTFDHDLLYKTFFTFLYYTGCRLGEVLALNYNDFDLKNKKVNISKNLSTKVTNKTYLITTPKTQSSYRTIIMPDILIYTLKDYIKQYPEIINEQFFFGFKKPLDDHSIYRRLQSHTKTLDIKQIRVHDFRHSHASFLINLGANVVLVAKRLGHTNTQQTLNTYAHLYPNSDEEIVMKINSL